MTLNNLLLLGQTTTDVYIQVQNAPDLVKTIAYADPNTGNERIISVASASAYLAITFTDTYNYQSREDGSFRLVTITRSRT